MVISGSALRAEPEINCRPEPSGLRAFGHQHILGIPKGTFGNILNGRAGIVALTKSQPALNSIESALRIMNNSCRMASFMK